MTDNGSRNRPDGVMPAIPPGEEAARAPSAVLDALLDYESRIAVLEMTEVFSADDLQRALHRLADAGWNTAILPAFFEGRPIYSSQVWADYGLKRRHPGFSGWDPFSVAFAVARERGLDIMTSHEPYLVGKPPNRRRAPILRRYPEWAAQRHPDRRQRRSEDIAAETFFCPVNREYLRFLGDSLHALLEYYPFQGFLLDLRQFPFYSSGDNYVQWCYCQTCREETLRELGFDPAGVDFEREKPMVERWREWQSDRMDQALAYLRMRSIKVGRTMRVLGLVDTESTPDSRRRRPLYRWENWVERSLIETLLLDGYSRKPNEYLTQVRTDLENLPENTLIIPMIPKNADLVAQMMDGLESEPVPGIAWRFDQWRRPDFDPPKPARFERPALAPESDPMGSICGLFHRMINMAYDHEEFCAFLGDLAHVLLRGGMDNMPVGKLLMVRDNVRGLYEQVLRGTLDFADRNPAILRDLDLAARLIHLAGGDLTD